MGDVMAGSIIREIKTATDTGVKLSPAMRDRLILAALVELYEASALQTQALEKHIKDSNDEMSKSMKEQQTKIKEHESRIEDLERHDLVRFAMDHPVLTLFIISVAIFLVFAGKPLLQAFGIFVP
jgi:hypothetical protein